MTNPFRGEVSVTLNGSEHIMRLSLGALVSLETALEADSLLALVERLESGTLRSADLMAVIHAGLEGGGNPLSKQDLLHAQIDGGILALADAAGRLVALSFAMPTHAD